MTEQRTCAFTGHRIIPAAERARLQARLERLIRRLYTEKNVKTFIAGGALGFDTMAALAVLKLAREFPDITLRLILPCADQDAKWREEDRRLYREILERAREREVLYPRYAEGCMLERNRRMVDLADVVVAYMRKPSGGTAYTVRYAGQTGKPVLNLFR